MTGPAESDGGFDIYKPKNKKELIKHDSSFIRARKDIKKRLTFGVVECGDGLVGHELELGQAELGNVPRFLTIQKLNFKPPGHIPNPPWHCAKQDLGMCPDWLISRP